MIHINTQNSKPLFLRHNSLRLLLFGGKGGVGKTTCASAAALYIARQQSQKKILLVSTDPAHSLEDRLNGMSLPENLSILEFNATSYLDKFMAVHRSTLNEIALRGTFLDQEDIHMFLNLSLPGLDELMAFLEICTWVEEKKYHCIIVDTAPTGHTIRLLSMPDLVHNWLDAIDTLLAKHRYMKKIFSGSYEPDEHDRFVLDLAAKVSKAKELFQNSEQCIFVPVMLADRLSFLETQDLLKELNQLKIKVQDILINRHYPETGCPVCTDRNGGLAREIAMVQNELNAYTLFTIPMQNCAFGKKNPVETLWQGIVQTDTLISMQKAVQPLPAQKIVRKKMLLPNSYRLMIFAGKGGVGKTTLACATAAHIAESFKDKKVLVFSTDPAHSLADCFDLPLGPDPVLVTDRLFAMEIDARAEFEGLKQAYARELEKFLHSISENIDLTFDRQVMEQLMDLSPTGIDEVMGIGIVMNYIKENRFDYYILDSAPTGHLIRLLEMPNLMDQWLKVFFRLFLKYKRIFKLPAISGRMILMSKQIKILRTLLKDKNRSSLFGVSILTQMALDETIDLVHAVKRAGIHMPVLFLNMATPESKCRFCSSLHNQEQSIQKKYKKTFKDLEQIPIPYQIQRIGVNHLKQLGALMYE